MNAGELARYKKLLLIKRDELYACGESSTSLSTGKLTAVSLVGDADAESEKEFEICIRNCSLFDEIERALMRMRRESFGQCEGCRQPISKARLEATPWTPLCRECGRQEFF